MGVRNIAQTFVIQKQRPEFEPQEPLESGMVVSAPNPSTGEAGTGRHLGLAVQIAFLAGHCPKSTVHGV